MALEKYDPRGVLAAIAEVSRSQRKLGKCLRSTGFLCLHDEKAASCFFVAHEAL